MIDYKILKNLALEALKATPKSQFGVFGNEVGKLAMQKRISHSERLEKIDVKNLNQIIWDLIVDRVLTVGIDPSNDKWPFFRLTEFGDSVVNQEKPTFYDPEGYGELLDSFASQPDDLIKQYAIEGLNCFRQRLYFAAAVMFGAAAERAILILLEAIKEAETNTKRQEKIKKLLNGQTNLPEIFKTIQDSISRAKSTMPYSIHKGCKEHLLSLFEMIRVQRNDAVHPAAGEVNKTKVLLITQSFPGALEVIYHLTDWFKNNTI